MLSPEASAEPGRWDTSRAEYQRGIMDAVSDPSVHTVVVKSSAQVGKTEIINNTAGFHIDQDPAPILVLQPTLEMGQAWSKDRLAPLLRDTPALHGKVQDARSRDSGNTLLHKTFPGGHLTIAGANSPASLASRPIRVFLGDEIDRYPASAGTEGDPVTLASKRLTTFWNRFRLLTSTPTIKGQSRIDAAYNESDQRKFMVPCPDCGHSQELQWAQVRWHKDEDEDGNTIEHCPETAEYACVECGSLWDDVRRWRAVSHGEWQATAPFNGVAGFHLSELYSPWVKLSEIAQAFLDAKGNPERLKVWTNTSLGEVWEEKGHTVEGDHILSDLAENYGPEDLPDQVAFATAGVDVQDNRLELEVVGWGPGERSWGIRYEVIHGDPAQKPVWDELDKVLLETFTTESGRIIRIAAAAIDTGGHHAEAVYRFCASRFRRGIHPINGQAGQGKPVWPLRASKALNGKYQVFTIGVDTIKDAMFARWKIEGDKDGCCRIPADPTLGYDKTWADQATSEQRMTRFREGRPYQVWVLPSGKRNEALDCRNYAFAALRSIPRKQRERALRKREVEPTQPTEQPATQPEAAPVAVQRRKPQKTAPGNDWLGGRGSNWSY